MKSSILILGATGSIGYAFTENLLSKNIPVTILVRNRAKAQKLFPTAKTLEIIEGDVQDLGLLKQISADKNVIFHGINYPYNEWFGNMDTATLKIIEAAAQQHATIIFPGNVYNFGNIATPIQENSPENPCTKKGALRVEIEKMLQNAAESGKCQVINVRLPDFWGPNVTNAGVEPIFLGALQKKAMPWMLTVDIPHQSVFTKDAGEIIVRIMQKGSEKPYEVFNYGGITMPTTRSFFEKIAKNANVPVKITIYNRFVLSLVGIFSPVVREVKEMLYLYENSIILDDSKVRKLFPDFKETPLDKAIAETLDWFKKNRLK